MSEPLTVELAERSYPIYIDKDVATPLKQTLSGLSDLNRPCALLIDENVQQKHEGFIADVFKGLPSLILPSGEKTKSYKFLEKACEFLADNRIDRTGALFALGGGVLGDLAGYAAASYLRGIDYYKIPTTLLSMVDSSVGGKTGINLSAGKNLAGAFWQPKAVYIGIRFLTTLAPREFAAGMAEVVKYGLLADGELFEKQVALEDVLGPKHDELPRIIRRCCEIKAQIVRADEKETAGSNGRALLNLGHTFAHAIENVAGYGYYLHGEAVSIGLVLAAMLSQEYGNLDEGDVAIIAEVLDRYNLPVSLRDPMHIEKLMEAMYRDKKVRTGRLRFVTLREIGRAVTVEDVDEDLIRKLWAEAGAE